MIDLRSDTVTKPSPEMREAMAQAEVGDDVYGEDPTVNKLQEYAAQLFDKEAALLVPSGTMGNLVAFLSQTRPGDSIILSESAHPLHYENANIAMLGGLLPRAIPDPLGKITPQQIEARIVNRDDPHFSHTTLVAIENTTNRGGGACYTYEEIEQIGALCQRYKLKLHCDGARIFNASTANNMNVQFYTQPCTTISFCLSKGLGAPAGSLIVGDRATIHDAIRFRKMLGGGMRQVGILAAAGLYALQHHIDDLEEDHRRAQQFRRTLEERNIRFPLPSPTNILYLNVSDAPKAKAQLAEKGVLVQALGKRRLRVVFHRDIDDNALDQAIDASIQVLSP